MCVHVCVYVCVCMCACLCVCVCVFDSRVRLGAHMSIIHVHMIRTNSLSKVHQTSGHLTFEGES